MNRTLQKRINAILFFATKERNNKINRLKLMKLLWLADRIHLNRYGRTIIDDNYFALEHGPVPSLSKNLSDTGYDDKIYISDRDVIAEDEFEDKYFSKSDLSIMEEVWTAYGAMNKYNLRDFSHYFPEWKRFEEKLNDSRESDSFPMEMADFFAPPIQKLDNYSHDSELSAMSKAEYEERKRIQEALSK